MPKVFAEPAQRYFQFVQQAVVANVELATKWTELVATFSGAKRVRATDVGDALQDTVDAVNEVVQETTESASGVVPDTTDAVSDAAQDVADNADNVDDVVGETTATAASPAEEQSEETDDQAVERALEAERAEAKHAHMLAREPYLSLTKAELSALLAERGLPKSGTINTLVERLVAADQQA